MLKAIGPFTTPRTACGLSPRAAVLWAFVLVVLPAATGSADDLLLIHQGDLPIVISAPHGGRLKMSKVPERQGEGLPKGSSGFFSGRDSGTEELALQLVHQLEIRFQAKPSYVISRVHRQYVDFNRPVAIAVEHEAPRVIYDQYHDSLREFCRRIRHETPDGRGLLIDIHGQGSSPVTVYRGTKNGLTVSNLRSLFGEAAHEGPASLFGMLKHQGWTVHPDPHNGREQSGFTGGYIVQAYGSHRGDGIDAVQLEFGSTYRMAAAREQTASQLADAVVLYARRYLPALTVPGATEQ